MRGTRRRLATDSCGLSQVEYVLITALVAAASMGSWTLLGSRVGEETDCVARAIGAGGSAPCWGAAPLAAGRVTTTAPAPPLTYEDRIEAARSDLEAGFDETSGGDGIIDDDDLARACDAGNAGACFFVENESARYALDVGDDDGDVDGDISLDDVEGFAEALQSEPLGELLADTAGGEGDRDGRYSPDDLEDLLDDEGLPPEVRAWAESVDPNASDDSCSGFSLCQLGDAASAVTGAAEWAWDHREYAVVAAGFVPGVGQAIDLYEASRVFIDVARGEASWSDVALAAVAFVPGGDVARFADEALSVVDDIGAHADEVVDVARGADNAHDAARVADEAEGATDSAGAGWAAGARRSVDDLDDVTREMLQRYNLDPDSRVYRWVEPGHLEPSGTIAGNPRSIALVGDEYNRVRNPLVEQFEEAGLDVPESLPRTVAPSRNASELGPSLNVSVNRSDAYGGGGRVLVSVRVGDVLDTGGRIYPDVGAAAQGIRPLVVTVPRAVPYRVESPPAP